MQAAIKIIKNTGFLYAKMGITMFISLYTTRLILNSLGAEDFGIFNIVGGAIALLGFLNVAMAGATQRFMSYSNGEGDQKKLKKIFNISIVLHFFIAISMVIFLLVSGWFFFNGILNISHERIYAAKVVYGCLIISTMFTVMTVPYDAVINARENMLYYAIVGVLESILKLLIAFAVVYTAGDKLIIYGFLMSFIPIFSFIIMCIYCHKNYTECSFSPKKYWDKKLMVNISKFAGWNLIAATTSIISQYGLSILLNSFFGTLLNAAQGVANQISGQLMSFSNTLMKAINPVISKSEGSGDKGMMLETSLIGSKLSFFLLAFWGIPFIIEAPFILQIWLKNVPPWTILFTRLQLIRSLIEQLTAMLGNAIYANGEIKIYIIFRSILFILPIILTYILFYYEYPPYYLYIVWIICGGILGGILSIYFTKLKCGLRIIDYLNKILIPCLGTSILMIVFGLAITNLMPPSFIRLICVGLISSLTFIFSLRYVFLLKQEYIWLNMLTSSLKSKLKFYRKVNLQK